MRQRKRLTDVERKLNNLMAEIFNGHINNLQDQRDSIRDAQYIHVGSPNYFFRGQTFISDQGKNVPPLADHLRDIASKHLKEVNALEQSKRVVQTYFAKLAMIVKDEDHLYFVLPNSVRQYGLLKPEGQMPDYIEDILDGTELEPFNVMNTEALYNMVK